MSDKPTHRSGEKWQPGNNNAGPVTRGALAKMLEGEGAEDETVGDELLSDKEGIPVDVQSQDWSVRLPDDIVLTLFKFYLKPRDVLATSQTCQRWRRLGENETLWKQKCKQAGLTFILTPANKRALKRRSEDTAIVYSAWKENFLKHYKIAKKFREGVPQKITIEMINGIDEMEISNDKIVTTSEKKHSVFSALSVKLLHELVDEVHRNGPILMDDLFIVSGCLDGSVKVWDVENGTCLHTMLGHTGVVTCLQLHGAIAVSGSRDGTLRMWDIREGNCIRTLTGHTGWVSRIQFDGRRVVSSSHDKTIKIWDSATGECLRTLIHKYHVYCLKFNGVDVAAKYYVSHPGSIEVKVWKVDTGICRHTLEGNGGGGMELEGDLLVCRGADETTAKIWNLSTGACLHTLADPHKHIDRISDIQISEKFVVTSSWDGTVKLWDIKTGEFIRDLVLESGGRVQRMRMKNAKIVCHVEVRISKLLVLINFDTNDED